MLPNEHLILSRETVEGIIFALENGLVVLTSDGQQRLLEFFASNSDESALSTRFDQAVANLLSSAE